MAWGGERPYAIQLRLSSQPPTAASLPSLNLPPDYILYVNPVTLKNRQWYQLRLGFFRSVAEAREINRELQEKFPGSWILRASASEREQAPGRALKLPGGPGTAIPRPANALSQAPAAAEGEDRLGRLMEEARRAMAQGQYSRAVALYTKILQFKDNPYSRDALEFLGVARERKGQLAHAKAVYEQYLRLYPQGEGAERVRQRLNGILTARAEPRPRQKRTLTTKPRRTDGQWIVFGGFSQFYRRDASYVDKGGSSVDQSSIISDLDISGRYRDGRYDVRTRFSGGYDYDLLSANNNDNRISELYAEGRDLERHASARVGRQTLSTGGVLGRFDGLWARYQLDQTTRINFVTGFPVERSTNDYVDTDRHFYGLNADLGTFRDSWDFNTFFIKQLVDGVVDRKAVGGEARYFKDDRSLFALVDYDLEYSSVNIAQLLGNLTLPDQTTVNLLMEYRKSPLLTTSNALIGQNADTIKALQRQFSSEQMEDLARDRTADFTTLSLSASHPWYQHYQVSGEITITHLSDMPASGGVDAVDGSGYEYFYDVQLLANDMLQPGDLTILGARFSDTASAYITHLSLDTRLPLRPLLRINPRVFFNYRSFKKSSGDQWTLSPQVRLDYQWRRRRHFELDAGGEWSTRNLASDSQDSYAYFINLGYRLDF
ncbi:MAG TPA: hypothetical protein ENK48_00920 [Gammaproteobacteria bacterium]|nr:hypothetical protein [Gammaproteobacteria bacterium]